MGLLDRIIDAAAGRILDAAGIDDLIKSRAAAGGTGAKGPIPPDDTPEEIKALLVDPFALLETMGYRERYSMVSYDVLQRMAYNVPIYPAIMQTRLNQVATFSEPEHDPALPGYIITLRDHEGKPGKKQKIEMQDLAEWVQNTGSSPSLARDNFDAYLRKLVRDMCIYDQSCTNIIDNRKGIPCEFYALDGASIRIADSAWTQQNDDDRIRYVQVHDETVIAEFTAKELCFGVCNPRSDLKVNGYGMSNLEIGLTIATAMMNGVSYNSKFFSQGTVAKGMLNLPKVPDAKLRVFARQWHMIVSGISNGWRTPITNFEDAKWIDLAKSNRDMEWSEFINFLIKLFSGICQIDPQELNFQFGNTGQTGQIGGGAPAEEKIKASKDRGLRPILRSIQNWLNRWIIWRINPEYKLMFTGLDPREGETVVNIESKQVTYLKTVNELRAENDLKELSPEQGDLILNPQWMQAYQSAKQQEMMAQQQQGGGPGQEQGQPGEQPPGEGEPDQPGEGEQQQPEEGPDWSTMLGQHLGKAHVEQRISGETIKYDIDL